MVWIRLIAEEVGRQQIWDTFLEMKLAGLGDKRVNNKAGIKTVTGIADADGRNFRGLGLQ